MAEWAQLLAGPPAQTPLERGHWYGVVDRLNSAMLRLSGPNAIGVMIHADMVRLTNREPSSATRVQARGFLPMEPGQPTPMMTFYGVCPKGHRIDSLSIGDSDVKCSKCERSYFVEDEQHI